MTPRWRPGDPDPAWTRPTGTEAQIGERIEPADGDERKVGTITAAVPIRSLGRIPDTPPPPPGDPAWDRMIVTPDMVGSVLGDSGIVVARDLDDALRKAR